MGPYMSPVLFIQAMHSQTDIQLCTALLVGCALTCLTVAWQTPDTILELISVEGRLACGGDVSAGPCHLYEATFLPGVCAGLASHLA